MGAVTSKEGYDLGTGHKVQGGGGVVYENFFFKYWFSVAHPRVI